MGRSIVIHKKKDGTVTLDGDAPDQLVVSTRLIASGATEGHISTELTYHFANGAHATYKVVGPALGDPNNENSPITGFHVEKVSEKKAKPVAVKKART